MQGKGVRCLDYRVRFTCPESFCTGGKEQTTPTSETTTPPSLTPTLEQVQSTSSIPVKECKTKWINRDKPTATGDYELIYYIRKDHPKDICQKPIALEVQTVDGTPANQTGQHFARNDVVNGFACINADQGKGRFCLDYKVRFTCPESFCSGGDQKDPTG
ncbi:cartilage intermediate layer protein 1-like [Pogona vitticeps]